MAFELTNRSLRRHCRELKLYASCLELNDVLHLHHKGIEKLQSLEPFTGLRTLYLEGNAIRTIEGLNELTNLRSLSLNQNLIYDIEGLETLKQLEVLDLSDNQISKIENLACCPLLRQLTITGNKIASEGDVRHLKECPSLRSLDLSGNKIADETALDVIKTLPLTLLRLVGNPVVSTTSYYRKSLIVAIPTLKYLDDSPVFEKERRLAEAWARGGLDAEKAMRGAIRDEEVQTRERHRQAFDDMIAETRANAARERLEAARSAAAEHIVSEAIGAAVESTMKEAEAAETERNAAEAERKLHERTADQEGFADESSAPLDSAGVPVEEVGAESGCETRAPLTLDIDGLPAEETQGSAGSPADSDHSFEKVEKASPESRGSGNGTPEAGGIGDWVMVGDTSGTSTPEREARNERNRNKDVELDVTAIAKLSDDAREHRAREEAFRAEARARALERAAVRAEEVLNNSSHALLLESARALGLATSGRNSRRASIEKSAGLATDAEEAAAAKSDGVGEGKPLECDDLQELGVGNNEEDVEVLTLTERRPVIWGTAKFRDLWTGAVRLGEAQEPASEAELVGGNAKPPEEGGETLGDVSLGLDAVDLGRDDVTSDRDNCREGHTLDNVFGEDAAERDVKPESDECAETIEVGQNLLKESCAPQEAESSSPVVRKIAWPVQKGHVTAGDCADSRGSKVEQDLLPGCNRAVIRGSVEGDINKQISAVPMLTEEESGNDNAGPSFDHFELDEMD
ncbi:hypothetical protein KFL_008450040 [Klebsormidium nitens]|uniref:Dynein assembly factor 1, axonemal homolog n=1 Tax=Klebsormidium nitens TaxID=105231 RepID=A0A1Y1IR77_KLENI|nr:hypothetical protein KFL_008450040 [Klebsormidium nitens]|eukprot:GAQ91751.1 hypothetical protein KFL_008450040 [Klebsormidium nitens]